MGGFIFLIPFLVITFIWMFRWGSRFEDFDENVAILIMAAGFPDTEAKLKAAGFDILTVPMTEFEKQDGGLSCLSIRIPKRNFPGV